MIGEYPTPTSMRKARLDREKALAKLQGPEVDCSYYGLRAPILDLEPRDDDSEHNAQDPAQQQKQQCPAAPMTFVQTLFLTLLMWITGETDEVVGASVKKAEDKTSLVLKKSVQFSPQQGEPYVFGPYTKPAPVSHATKVVSPPSNRSRWPVNVTFCEEMRKKNRENWERKQRKESASKDALISEATAIVDNRGKGVAVTAATSKLARSDHVDLHKAQLLERVQAAVPASATTDSLENIHKDFVPEDQDSESDESDEDEEMPSSVEHIEEGLIVEDDENNLLFSSLVEALSAFTFDDQPVQEKRIQQGAALPTLLSSPAPSFDDQPVQEKRIQQGAALPTLLSSPAPSFVAKSITSTDTDEGEDSDVDFDAIVSELVLSIEGIEPVQGETVKQDPPLPAFAKPGPSVAPSAASAVSTAAVTVMDSKPTVTVAMPAGRAIARMRKKKPSVTPVVVMPTDRRIAKPRARARGLNSDRLI